MSSSAEMVTDRNGRTGSPMSATDLTHADADDDADDDDEDADDDDEDDDEDDDDVY